MSKLKLTLACLDSDRVKPLMTKAVEPVGIELNVLPYSPDRSVWAMVKRQEFDVSEMTLAIYARLCASGQTPYIAIPVFLARTFPHGGIFVNKKAGIKEPKDLEGKKVACGQFQMTVAVWARGVLQEKYGVDLKAINWHTRENEIIFEPPAEFNITVLSPGKALPDRLADGDIDALILPRVAPQFRVEHPHVMRLFPNYDDVELDYFTRTKIFPILHTVVIHEKIYDRHPWVASSLFRAFVEAKEICYRDLGETMEGSLYTVPWLERYIEKIWKTMGKDFWPYGLHANRHVLETYI
ncbi:MAG: ABC transporter substrate-binding protein, partial [Thermodesulfobacteriota bacterium]